MSEEVEIPVKVVDRRRWREDGEANPAAAEPTSLKPTYVEELEQRVAQAEKYPEWRVGNEFRATREAMLKK